MRGILIALMLVCSFTFVFAGSSIDSVFVLEDETIVGDYVPSGDSFCISSWIVGVIVAVALALAWKLFSKTSKTRKPARKKNVKRARRKIAKRVSAVTKRSSKKNIKKKALKKRAVRKKIERS